MSLKSFHVFFILISILLLAGYGYDTIRGFAESQSTPSLALGWLSLAGAAGLTGYLGWFIRKSKGLPS